MAALAVADLAFGYGANQLFTGVTFSLEAGERAALVAPNGAGKSTLLRLVAGELTPDAGAVTVKKGASLGYYRQSHELSREGDVLGAFLAGFSEVLALRAERDRAIAEAVSGDDAALAALAVALDRYQHAHGDELERKVGILAERLGFSDADLARPVTSLSGGERGRLLLGTVLAREPELLLLDEPTNHLDLDTIRWLEGYLSAYAGAVLIVSHDRAFLDATTGATLELGRRGLRVYPLAYSAYAEARAADLEREEALFADQQAFIQKTEDFIRKNIAGQKTKQAQSRRKMLDKLDVTARPEDVWSRAERVSFRFVPAPRSGDIVLDAKGLGASRGGRALFSGLDLFIKRGERVAIVGPNGAGKSTLLKLLAGEGAPEDEGRVRRGTNLCEGVFDQHLGALVEERSLIDEIRSVKGDLNVDGARQYLARFRFYGDDPFREIRGMSGGERSRVALAKLLLEPRNLLFLDEPTNHLDIPAAEILEEALVGFDGTVVFVSHDRRFLSTVATRCVTVEAGAAADHPGTFDDLVAWQARRDAAARPSAPPPKAREKVAAKESFEAERARARAWEKKKKRLAELEDEIARCEGELSTLVDALKEDPGGDWEGLARRAKEEQARRRELERLMSEWSNLGDELARGPR